MPKTRKIVLTQGGNDAFVQGSIRIGGRRLILIHDLQIKIALGAVWADTHQLQVALTNASQASMPTPNNNSVQIYKEVTQVGNPASMVDLSWNIRNLPAFTTDDSLFFQLDSANTGAVNNAYITIYYDEKKVI